MREKSLLLPNLSPWSAILKIESNTLNMSIPTQVQSIKMFIVIFKSKDLMSHTAYSLRQKN